jgi:hypothetical protein
VSRSGAGDRGLTDVSEPEFFSEEALQGVYGLNGALIDLLVAAAGRPAAEVRPYLAVALGPTLLALGADARQHLARCPVAFVDLEFRNVEWWRQVECGQGVPQAGCVSPGCFPRLQAIRLAQTTLTLAWTIVRSSREAGAIIFGLAPECAARLAGLGVQAIPQIAETYPQFARPRWESDTAFWRELIRIAHASVSPAQVRLPPLGVYVMQRQFAELLALSTRPATHETASSRPNGR